MCKKGDILRIPVANGEGNYFSSDKDLTELQDNSQIVLRYSDENGSTNSDSNPNGSTHNIAGICNKSGNVLGMMPHPERCCEQVVGGEDGRVIFESIINHVSNNL